MKAKILIAMFALLALSVTIFAGCTINPPQAQGLGPPPLPEGMTPDQLSAAERQRLIDTYGLDPDTLMLPMPPDLNTDMGTTLPPLETMPQGVAAQSQEVYPMLRNVIDTFATGRFYLRGHTTVPDNEFTQSAGSVPIAMASDGERFVMEQNINWNDMLQTDGFDFGASRIQAAIFNTTFGNQMRMIFDPAGPGPIIAFPVRNSYLSLADLAGALGGEMPDMGMDMEDFDLVGIGTLEIPNDLRSTRVTAGGREYLTATIPNEDDGTNTFFFHNGQLVRMETRLADGSLSIIEVETFHGNPPASMFTTQGLTRMPLSQIMSLFEGMGGEGGGIGGLFG